MVKDLSYFHLPKINSSTLYSILKRFIKVFIPKELLRQTEPFLRNIYSIFYFGNKVECAVCGNHHSKFIVLKNGEINFINKLKIASNAKIANIADAKFGFPKVEIILSSVNLPLISKNCKVDFCSKE